MRLIRIISLCLFSIMHIVAYAQEIPNNEIWYTASSKLKETTNGSTSGLHTNAFGVSISSHTFWEGRGIIKFDGDVTFIGNDAFYKCEDLTSVIIPNSVDGIGNYAFEFCSSLTSINIPRSVTSIGRMAFCGCSNLTSVNILKAVISIGDGAFKDCPKLASVPQVNALTSAEHNTSKSIQNNQILYTASHKLLEAKDLNSEGLHRDNFNASILYHVHGVIKFNRDVTSIGNHAFYNCTSMTSINIPNTVTSIGNSAFKGCSNLTSFIFPESITSIGDSAFYNCLGLTSVVVKWTEPADILIPRANAFSNLSNVKLYIPTGTRALYEAANIWNSFETIIENSNITFADENVKKICVANWDTNNDGELSNTEAAIVTDLGYVFKGNSTITTINELSYFTALKSIGSSAFSGCKGLTSITIPNFITSIGDYAFSNCSSLTSITIGNSVKSIGLGAFADCSSLTSIIIPDSVTSIGYEAFARCSSLTSVTIGNSVTSIEAHAFSGCSSLTSVTIGNSVTSIDETTFEGCTSLPVVDNLRYADTYLVGPVDKTLSTYTIKEGTKWIGDYAFSGCSSLTSITIPNSVTSIGREAFDYYYTRVSNFESNYKKYFVGTWKGDVVERGGEKVYSKLVFKNDFTYTLTLNYSKNSTQIHPWTGLQTHYHWSGCYESQGKIVLTPSGIVPIRDDDQAYISNLVYTINGVKYKPGDGLDSKIVQLSTFYEQLKHLIKDSDGSYYELFDEKPNKMYNVNHPDLIQFTKVSGGSTKSSKTTSTKKSTSANTKSGSTRKK